MEKLNSRIINNRKELRDWLDGLNAEVADISSLVASLRVKRDKELAEAEVRDKAKAERLAKLTATELKLADAKSLLAKVEAEEKAAKEAEVRAVATAKAQKEAILEAERLVGKSR